MKNCPYSLSRNLFLLSVFAVAMGILEAIVVVYLRQMYYPQGFNFPLTLLSQKMMITEWIREIMTLVMLVSLGMISGKDSFQRFLFFLYIFAVWDIFYYAGLKLFLNWPVSFFTFDVLFLIPVPWISPVLAPLLCSMTMILFSVSMLVLREKGLSVCLLKREWGLAFTGVMLTFCSFIWDYTAIVIKNGFILNILSLPENDPFWKRLSQYQPEDYHWSLFAAGELLVVYVFFRVLKRCKNKSFK